MPIASKSTYTEKAKRRMPQLDDVFDRRGNAKIAPSRDVWNEGNKFTDATSKVVAGRARQQASW